MTAVSVALTRAYQNNIDRYRRLLRTRLTDLERQFIERRLAEELVALELVRQPSADELIVFFARGRPKNRSSL